MNPVEIGLAFVEGLALIASPCILPVLPLVLSGSVEGGKARPFGITLGFVLAFSVFVLASRQIVGIFHINPDVLRYVCLTLLFALGLVMLSEKLSQKFASLTQGLANAGGKFGVNGKGGFGSGVAIGALIGLVWTPCAGPILAAVLVQVIQQKTNLQGIAVTVAFAVGAALPMLAIALTGKSLIKRFGFLTRHAETVRKVFAVLILLSVATMAFGADIPNPFAHKTASPQGQAMSLQDGLAAPYPAPEITGIKAWLNSSPLVLQQLRGKVVLVDFWTYSCVNCVRTLPYITEWDRQYRDSGLVIIGIHAPEFEFEKNVENIQTAMAKYGIHYPVAVDNNLATWINFKNRYWPAHYLIDKNGNVVYTHFGEGAYDVTENNIRYLLDIHEAAAANAVMPPRLLDETPETYLGYGRAERFQSSNAQQKDVVASYQAQNMVPEHQWSLGGLWKVEREKITAAEKGSSLRLNFKAKKVYLVMGTANGQPQSISLKLNGASLAKSAAGKDVLKSQVFVDGHALYELVNQAAPDNGLLEITAEGEGVEMYAFTFGE